MQAINVNFLAIQAATFSFQYIFFEIFSGPFFARRLCQTSEN